MVFSCVITNLPPTATEEQVRAIVKLAPMNIEAPLAVTLPTARFLVPNVTGRAEVVVNTPEELARLSEIRGFNVDGYVLGSFAHAYTALPSTLPKQNKGEYLRMVGHMKASLEATKRKKQQLREEKEKQRRAAKERREREVAERERRDRERQREREDRDRRGRGRDNRRRSLSRDYGRRRCSRSPSYDRRGRRYDSRSPSRDRRYRRRSYSRSLSYDRRRRGNSRDGGHRRRDRSDSLPRRRTRRSYTPSSRGSSIPRRKRSLSARSSVSYSSGSLYTRSSSR